MSRRLGGRVLGVIAVACAVCCHTAAHASQVAGTRDTQFLNKYQRSTDPFVDGDSANLLRQKHDVCEYCSRHPDRAEWKVCRDCAEKNELKKVGQMAKDSLKIARENIDTLLVKLRTPERNRLNVDAIDPGKKVKELNEISKKNVRADKRKSLVARRVAMSKIKFGPRYREQTRQKLGAKSTNSLLRQFKNDLALSAASKPKSRIKKCAREMGSEIVGAQHAGDNSTYRVIDDDQCVCYCNQSKQKPKTNEAGADKKLKTNSIDDEQKRKSNTKLPEPNKVNISPDTPKGGLFHSKYRLKEPKLKRKPNGDKDQNELDTVGSSKKLLQDEQIHEPELSAANSNLAHEKTEPICTKCMMNKLKDETIPTDDKYVKVEIVTDEPTPNNVPQNKKPAEQTLETTKQIQDDVVQAKKYPKISKKHDKTKQKIKIKPIRKLKTPPKILRKKLLAKEPEEPTESPVIKNTDARNEISAVTQTNDEVVKETNVHTNALPVSPNLEDDKPAEDDKSVKSKSSVKDVIIKTEENKPAEIQETKPNEDMPQVSKKNPLSLKEKLMIRRLFLHPKNKATPKMSLKEKLLLKKQDRKHDIRAKLLQRKKSPGLTEGDPGTAIEAPGDKSKASAPDETMLEAPGVNFDKIKDMGKKLKDQFVDIMQEGKNFIHDGGKQVSDTVKGKAKDLLKENDPAQSKTATDDNQSNTLTTSATEDELPVNSLQNKLKINSDIRKAIVDANNKASHNTESTVLKSNAPPSVLTQPTVEDVQKQNLRDVYFMANGVKFPVMIIQNQDGSFDLALDSKKMCKKCDCSDCVNCQQNLQSTNLGELYKNKCNCNKDEMVGASLTDEKLLKIIERTDLDTLQEIQDKLQDSKALPRNLLDRSRTGLRKYKKETVKPTQMPLVKYILERARSNIDVLKEDSIVGKILKNSDEIVGAKQGEQTDDGKKKNKFKIFDRILDLAHDLVEKPID